MQSLHIPRKLLDKQENADGSPSGGAVGRAKPGPVTTALEPHVVDIAPRELSVDSSQVL